MANSKKPRPAESAPKPSVDLRELERLLDFMGAHGLEELEYGREGFHVRLKKAWSGRSHGSHSSLFSEGRAVESPRERSSSEPEASDAQSSKTDGLHIVKSPIVGTYYASPNPESPAFVGVGDHVKNKQVLCIIEAMKLMNEIESDIDGEIVKSFVANGQPVEYGEALFGIRPLDKK